MGGVEDDLDEFAYCMESGSNRFGALDFQKSPREYEARDEHGTLEELAGASELIQRGLPLPAGLAEALGHGTSIGGARPKVLVREGGVEWIAKLSRADDPYPVILAEAAALEVARRAGVEVPESHVVRAAGRDVLMVRRFDRQGQRRRACVSGLTLAGLDEMQGRYATYPDILEVVRRRSRHPADVGPVMFRRIALNIVVGNNDDHARNHAAFVEGVESTLEWTPAFDLCPQRGDGWEANQAMAYGAGGEKASDLRALIRCHALYDLTRAEASGVIEEVVTAVHDGWHGAADRVGLTAEQDRRLIFGKMVLHPAVVEGLPKPLATRVNSAAG